MLPERLDQQLTTTHSEKPGKLVELRSATNSTINAMIAVEPAAMVRHLINHGYDQDQTWETGSVATKTYGKNDEMTRVAESATTEKLHI
jgi:hypothetical protein